MAVGTTEIPLNYRGDGVELTVTPRELKLQPLRLPQQQYL